MRREAVQFVQQAVSAGRRAYVLVNNRAEGNAPLTVQAFVEMLRARLLDRAFPRRGDTFALPYMSEPISLGEASS